MRMYDIITKKKHNEELTNEEITWMIEGFVKGDIPDYQMSAFMMAVYFNGMTDEEMTNLTMAMAKSGDMVDLSAIEGIKVDKHSTGGVGDKTTLVVAPIVAACGVKVAKMSGKGLGHTGGTIDKLESIPGYNTTIGREEFFDIVNKTGLSVIGQSGNIAPADKKLYALRDVTATVDSVPLIASSIMSKKLASGSDCILLDVKMGSGAFMKTEEDAYLLAEKMVEIGNKAGRKVAALITDMDIPLGNAIGNSLEVIEAVNTLKGQGPEDLTDICIELATHMLLLADKGDIDTCREMVKDAIKSGKALEKLALMVEAHGGNAEYIRNTELFDKAQHTMEVKASKSGYIASINTEQCGIASVVLEAGRETKESLIDYSAGIVLKKKVGDYVNQGDTIAVLYTNNCNKLEGACKILEDSCKIREVQPEKRPIILRIINKFLKS
ncbi:MAG: pyrimidine-nucleoside phosphorylase [Lachnospiraceae bacterium]|nr:pyrimidine-nucleoside phosphorylase [Lachnospiraceae bacterium]